MLTIKRTRVERITADFEFSVRELAEKFTDEQLRAEGLFRDLRDADIARERLLRANARSACDDEDCECSCHNSHPAGGLVEGGLVEREFWPLIRALLLRHDIPALQHELETRAWDHGNTTVDFSRVWPRS